MDDVTLNGKVHPCLEVVEACGEFCAFVNQLGGNLGQLRFPVLQH
jgi:hypothetical protein